LHYGWRPSDLKKKLLPAAKALGIIPAGQVRDHYQLLGVRTKATPQEIKQAFRNRAFRVHPDTASDPSADAESFQRLLDAYHTLHDPVRRRRYDANRQRRWREYPARLIPANTPAPVNQWYLGGLILIFIVLLLLLVIIDGG
jgi:DnaJ-domain-containing protein 1